MRVEVAILGPLEARVDGRSVPVAAGRQRALLVLLTVRSPEPVAAEVESARLLANETRPVLGAEGYADQRIDELADAFIAHDIGEGTEEFLRWARLQGPIAQGEEEL